MEFVQEYEASRFIGFSTGFYDHDAVEAGDLNEALKCLYNSNENRKLIIRGWMLTGERYAQLHAGLRNLGYEPQTSPESYEEAHYIPNAYKHTQGNTPNTAWIEGDDPDDAWKLYQQFKAKDVIIKDWVKSAKARWKDGCYIPADTSEERFREIFKVFRGERGKLFNRGVVLREVKITGR